MADEKNEKAEEKRRKAEEKLQAAAARKEELERKRAKNRSSVSKKSLVDALAQQNLPTYGNKATLQQRLEKCRTVAAASTSHAASNKENEAPQDGLLSQPR